jgi:glutamate-ammonia-ligase adenylyltransferase
MLRGNARDLFLPDESHMEYRYLARRIGYQRKEGRTEAEQLRIDFETHSARVRNFVERHLGREAIPGETSGSIVDLVLSDSLSENLIAQVLSTGGIRNIQRGLVNLHSLGGTGQQRDIFAQVIVLAWDQIRTTSDPDMALNNWEQFVRPLKNPNLHFNQLLSQPKRMELLMKLFSSSQFLSETLIQNPGFFRWITDPQVVGKARDQIRMEEDLRSEAVLAENRTDWLNRLRRFRKREILRIGLRDIGLGVKIEEIMGEISFLARACCEVSLEQVWKRLDLPPGPEASSFVVCAFGKLGGWELNYSSDIDLLGVYQPKGEHRTEEEEMGYTKVFRSFVQDLTDFTQEGQAYRIDLRLRPHGASGPIISTLPSFVEYYRSQGDLWEHQALIKMKPIAGNLSIGEIALDRIKPDYMTRWSADENKKKHCPDAGNGGSRAYKESRWQGRHQKRDRRHSRYRISHPRQTTHLMPTAPRHSLGEHPQGPYPAASGGAYFKG